MTLKKAILQKLVKAWPNGITAKDFPPGTSLTQRIADLKHQDGWDIMTIEQQHISYGRKGSHALYKLINYKGEEDGKVI